MPSTFNGLEVAKRALHTQQSALYTTGHNIANANTEGYTRQRVNMSPTAPFPPASRNRPEIPGQVGSGVEAGSIERIRDSFIDKQFRQENTKVGFYETRAAMMSKMESILNEPSEEGISQTFDLFWQSLQDLSVNPEDAGARSVVKERGIALSEAFNYTHDSLQDVRGNLADEIGVDGSKINSVIDQINGLNGQIAKIEPHGMVPNDLYDKRDNLIDELSEYMDIEVSYRASSGQPSSIAEGIATITMKSDPSVIQNAETNSAGEAKKIVLVDGSGEGSTVGEDDAVNHIFADFDNDNNVRALFFEDPNRDPDKKPEEYVEELVSGHDSNTYIFAKDYNVNGKLDSLIDGAGYISSEDDLEYTEVDGEMVIANGNAVGSINDKLAELDKLVYNFAKEFNNVHNDGFGLNNDTGLDFFDFNDTNFDEFTAASIKVNNEIIGDPNKIATSSGIDEPGNGENAGNLAEVYTKRAENYQYENADTDENRFAPKTSAKSFFEGVIGELGVQSQESNRMQGNSEVLRQQVEESRQAISSVSLDEEMTNLIQYQHAYNAAARNMTAVDEMLDRIINNMGLVGR